MTIGGTLCHPEWSVAKSNGSFCAGVRSFRAKLFAMIKPSPKGKPIIRRKVALMRKDSSALVGMTQWWRIDNIV